MSTTDVWENSAGMQQTAPTTHLRPTDWPFAGRLGGNQSLCLDRSDPSARAVLEAIPDAAPCMSISEQLNLKAFLLPSLWKAALIEGWGTLLFTYITIWANMSSNEPPQPPNAQLGNFNNAAFLGPAVGGILNFLLLTLFVFSFGTVTGAHFNPAITAATFFARLCSLPRATLYIASQTAGGALAGLLARASYGTTNFKVGGCWLFPDIVPPRETFAVEFLATALLLFFAFGTGMDPRQRNTISASLSPFLVGLSLGSLSFGTAFARYGYGGASMNPARCFGAFVGSTFPSWHWIHWIAPLAAGVVHGIFYHLAPPWQHQSDLPTTPVARQKDEPGIA